MTHISSLFPQILYLFLMAGYASASLPVHAAHQLALVAESRQINGHTDEIDPWKAGTTVSEESVQAVGWESCFASQTIGEEIFQRMKGKSYKADCTIPLSDLRYLKVLHYNLEGQICLGELVCHKDISNDLLEIFKELYQAHYPIERMVLIDEYNALDEPSMQANNTSCFNFRKVAGTNVLSNHSTGHAIDINPKYNPYVKVRNGKTIYQPKTGKAYINRSGSFPYKIDGNDLCYKIFKKHGFIWGGDWKSVKDFQHFEKKRN